MIRIVVGVWLLVLATAAGKMEGIPVKYGSLLRMRSNNGGFFLHSHEVTLRPQGPFSVTGFNFDSSDANSLWIVVEEYPKSTKTYKDVVNCGDRIQLQHSITEGRLGSSSTAVGLTSAELQLVHSTKGEGDRNNNWEVQCVGKEKGQPFMFQTEFRLLHVVTEKYLRFSTSQVYTEFNCGRGCSISGQLELHAVKEKTKDSIMRAVSGLAILD